MPTNGIIALLPVRSGQTASLRAALNRLGNDIRGRRLQAGNRPLIDFPASRTLHFARLSLLNDPDRGSEASRLLFVTDHDGDIETPLREILNLTSDPDAVWGRCEGFSATADFPGFIRSLIVDPQAYYIAFKGESLERIREWIDLRKRGDPAACGIPEPSFADKVRRITAAIGRILRAGWEALGLLIRHGPFNAVMAARRINASLDRIWWIRLFNRLTFNSMPAPPHRYSAAPALPSTECSPSTNDDEVVPGADWQGTPPEDVVSQNQLTVVTVVRPERVRRLKAVLAVIDLYATRLSTPGSLVGISTIHTVRWALIDGGKRLVMASNYDNTWENYIDEFAEMIRSGLDAIWENCHGWPSSGARDVAALKRFLRCHQVPANAFYSACPDATVLNIVDGMAMEASRPSTVLS